MHIAAKSLGTSSPVQTLFEPNITGIYGVCRVFLSTYLTGLETTTNIQNVYTRQF